MSLIEVVGSFALGLVVGAYGAWMGRHYIDAGIALMQVEKDLKPVEKDGEAKTEEDHKDEVSG